MSKGPKLFPVAVAMVATVAVAIVAAALLLPDEMCGHAPARSQGECLRLAASTTQFGRCRAIGALLSEIGNRHRDAVISSGLEGFVSARACGDLAVLRLQVPDPAPRRVVPMVDAALEACQAGTAYDLERRPTEAAPSPETVARLAHESGCSRISGTAVRP